MYNIAMITILAVLIIAVVVWKKRAEKQHLEELEIRQQKSSVKQKPTSAAIFGEAPTLTEPLKELTTLDIPMIQARFQNLGILNPLEQRHRDKLKRLTKDMCTSQKQGLWWAIRNSKFALLWQQRLHVLCVKPKPVDQEMLCAAHWHRYPKLDKWWFCVVIHLYSKNKRFISCSPCMGAIG